MKFYSGCLNNLVERLATGKAHVFNTREHFIAIGGSRSHLFTVEDLCFMLVMLREGRKLTLESK